MSDRNRGGEDMNEKQKKLVADILEASQKLSPEKQYQLLGVAQGLGMVPGNQDQETESRPA